MMPPLFENYIHSQKKTKIHTAHDRVDLTFTTIIYKNYIPSCQGKSYDSPSKFRYHQALVLSVKNPAWAVIAAQQCVGLVVIGDSASGAIVFEFLADTVGNQTQMHHLNRIAAILEITMCFPVVFTFAGLNPFFLEMSERRNYLVFRPLIVIRKVSIVAKRQHNP